jgi:hypothetical protein
MENEHIAYWFGKRVADGAPMVAVTLDNFVGRDRITTLEVIAGLMDRKGAVKVDERTGRRMLVFSFNRRDLIERVASIMERLGVKVGPIQERKQGYLTVYDITPDLESFKGAGCFFRDAEKQALLDQVTVAQASETLHADPDPETEGQDKVQSGEKSPECPAHGGQRKFRRMADRLPRAPSIPTRR